MTAAEELPDDWTLTRAGYDGAPLVAKRRTPRLEDVDVEITDSGEVEFECLADHGAFSFLGLSAVRVPPAVLRALIADATARGVTGWDRSKRSMTARYELTQDPGARRRWWYFGRAHAEACLASFNASGPNGACHDGYGPPPPFGDGAEVWAVVEAMETST